MTSPDPFHGPDVSVYDDAFPAQHVWGFAYIRRTIGLSPDVRSDAHMAAARALGVGYVGWYHYVTAGIDPALQAGYFAHHAVGADFLVADIEGATSDEQGREFIAALKAATGAPVIEYVQGSRRGVDRGADAQIVAAWGLRGLALGALGWQAWSSDSGLAAPVWVPVPGAGDWDALLDSGALDAIVARHRASQGGSRVPPYNLVPVTCRRTVRLARGVVLYGQDRQTIYTTLTHDVDLGYLMAADATWAIVADGDAGCYVKRSDFGAITTKDQTVGK